MHCHLNRGRCLSFFPALLVVLAGVVAAEARADDFLVKERPALPLPPGIEPQSICGMNDMQNVELYNGALGVSKEYAASNEKSTAQLQWLDESAIRNLLPKDDVGNVGGARWCTGTLIGEKLFLTAGHCFDVQTGDTGWQTPVKPGTNGQPEFEQPKQLAKLQVVNFNYQINKATGQIRTADIFPVTELLEYREGPNKLDYAILELGRNGQGKYPGEMYQPAKTLIQAPGNGAQLAIIQHPRGEPKQIDAGKVLGAVGGNLFYDNIDTLGGSSGSGVRNAEGAIVAVHTNGGCVVDQQGHSIDSANRGVLLQTIAAVSSRL